MRIGDKGIDVKRLQTVLNKDGYGLAVDGEFGRGTQSAVKKFQASYGLVADGIVGVKTLAMVDYLEKRLYSISWHGTKKYIQIIRFNKTSVDATDVLDSKGKLETLKSMFSRLDKKPTLLFNGSLFNMKTGESLNYFIDEGVNKGKNLFSPHGVRIDGKNGIKIISDPKGARDFIGFSPALVVNGMPTNERNNLDNAFYNGLHPRTAFGETDTEYFVIMVHGRRSTLGHRGMSIPELRDFCLAELKLKNAGNFDGGGSSLILNEFGKPINKYLEFRAIDNALAFYLK